MISLKGRESRSPAKKCRRRTLPIRRPRRTRFRAAEPMCSTLSKTRPGGHLAIMHGPASETVAGRFGGDSTPDRRGGSSGILSSKGRVGWGESLHVGRGDSGPSEDRSRGPDAERSDPWPTPAPTLATSTGGGLKPNVRFRAACSVLFLAQSGGVTASEPRSRWRDVPRTTNGRLSRARHW